MPTYGSGDSSFVSVAATKDSDDAKVFVAINATEDFQIGALPKLDLTQILLNVTENISIGSLLTLDLSETSTGVIVGLKSESIDGVATPLWQSLATSPKSVNFTDITIVPNSDTLKPGLVAVCGTFEKSITFSHVDEDGSVSQPDGLELNGESGSHGFCAFFSREDGTWVSAFITPYVLPTTVTSADSDTVVVAGQGALAARYQITNGSLSWKTPTDSETAIPREISSIPGGPIAVLSEDNSSPEEKGIRIHALDNSTGETTWSQSMGGLGQDTSSGMEVSKHGHIHLAFHSEKAGGSLLPHDSAIYSASISADGTFDWILPIAYQTTGTGKSLDFIQNSSLTTDSKGSSWLACYGLGDWQLGSLGEATLSHQAVYVKIDSAGNVTEYFKDKQTDRFVGLSNAITSAGNDRFFAVGDFENNSFLTSFRIIPGQELYSIYPRENNGLINFSQLSSILKSIGARPYIEIDEEHSASKTPFISAWLVDAQLEVLNVNGQIVVEKEAFLQSSGHTTDASESLRMIGNAYSSGTTYNYAETEEPVRLYLIDTAVANTDGWIDENPKLRFEETRLVRGNGDPISSSSFKHGTQMLSVIAGNNTGVSPGTPISVLNFDIYPDGDSTSATLIASAVYEAVGHYQDSETQVPSAICIASSSSTPSSSYALRSAIEFAVEEGLTVIVSAGNLGEDASTFIPAAYGTLDGVICTGAVDSAAKRIPSSNLGAPVDIHSPGLDILTIDHISSESLIPMTGTSPAAGFSTGIVLTELSANGARSPAILEETLKNYAKPLPSDLLILQATVAATIYNPDPEAEAPASPPLKITNGTSEKSLLFHEAAIPTTSAPAPDSDGDGTPNLLETFHGSDSNDDSSIPIAPAIVLSDSGETLLKFRVATELFDSENALTLKNGQNWGIQCSSNMTEWTAPSGILSVEENQDRSTWITASIISESSSCFLRIVVTDPAPAP